MMAGADFIKTSTGKESVNATLPVSLVMVRAIRDYRERDRLRVGFKPAGGIRTAKQALDWLMLMKEELGDDWLRARPLPLRRQRPAHRHRAPARILRHRALLGGIPSADGIEGNGGGGMAANDYHFITTWRVPGTTREVSEVLADAADLPRWWPSST